MTSVNQLKTTINYICQPIGAENQSNVAIIIDNINQLEMSTNLLEL